MKNKKFMKPLRSFVLKFFGHLSGPNVAVNNIKTIIWLYVGISTSPSVNSEFRVKDITDLAIDRLIFSCH